MDRANHFIRLPGWHSGRTTHIHLRLRSTYDASSSGGTNTMQLFFDQTLGNTLGTGVNPTQAKAKSGDERFRPRLHAAGKRHNADDACRQHCRWLQRHGENLPAHHLSCIDTLLFRSRLARPKP